MSTERGPGNEARVVVELTRAQAQRLLELTGFSGSKSGLAMEAREALARALSPPDEQQEARVAVCPGCGSASPHYIATPTGCTDPFHRARAASRSTEQPTRVKPWRGTMYICSTCGACELDEKDVDPGNSSGEKSWCYACGCEREIEEIDVIETPNRAASRSTEARVETCGWCDQPLDAPTGTNCPVPAMHPRAASRSTARVTGDSQLIPDDEILDRAPAQRSSTEAGCPTCECPHEARVTITREELETIRTVASTLPTTAPAHRKLWALYDRAVEANEQMGDDDPRPLRSSGEEEGEFVYTEERVRLPFQEETEKLRTALESAERRLVETEAEIARLRTWQNAYAKGRAGMVASADQDFARAGKAEAERDDQADRALRSEARARKAEAELARVETEGYKMLQARTVASEARAEALESAIREALIELDEQSPTWRGQTLAASIDRAREILYRAAGSSTEESE
jgi:hypothetical protein